MSQIVAQAREYLASNAAESGADVVIRELIDEVERMKRWAEIEAARRDQAMESLNKVVAQLSFVSSCFGPPDIKGPDGKLYTLTDEIKLRHFEAVRSDQQLSRVEMTHSCGLVDSTHCVRFDSFGLLGKPNAVEKTTMAKQRAKLHHQLTVQYKLVNGSHFFVGSDGCAETAGLCVGDRNLKRAFDQVGPALTYLLKRNHNIDTVCTPSRSFHDFRLWLLAQIGENLVGGCLDRGIDSRPVPASASRGKAKQWTIPTLERMAIPG